MLRRAEEGNAAHVCLQGDAAIPRKALRYRAQHVQLLCPRKKGIIP